MGMRGGREMWRAALVRMVYDGTQYDIHIHIHRLKRTRSEEDGEEVVNTSGE